MCEGELGTGEHEEVEMALIMNLEVKFGPGSVTSELWSGHSTFLPPGCQEE